MVLFEDWQKSKEERRKNFKFIIYMLIILIFPAIILNYSYIAYVTSIFGKIENVYETMFTSWLYMYSLLIVIILFIYKKYINKFTRKRKISIRKDFTDLLEPAIAEGIIDQRMNLKELIMSLILQMSIKGNINIINNNEIELVHKNNLNNYELELINILFVEKNKISFPEINTIMTASSNKFINVISNIKIDITRKIREMKLFDKISTQINVRIKCYIYMILIDLPFFLIINMLFETFLDGGIYGIEIEVALYIVMILENISMYIYMYNSKAKQINLKEYYIINKNETYNFIFGKLCIVLNVILMIIQLIANIHIGILYLIIFILIINIVESKDKIILTTKGYEEQNKLLGLKKYIENYSLMKDRDLKDVVIWDEYMAYAVAFGIPMKITNKIYENWYNLNITIQFWR